MFGFVCFVPFDYCVHVETTNTLTANYFTIQYTDVKTGTCSLQSRNPYYKVESFIYLKVKNLIYHKSKGV